MPKIIVRYEDLIKDSYSCFYKIINFLSKILNFKLDEEQIKFSVENSKFEKFQSGQVSHKSFSYQWIYDR